MTALLVVYVIVALLIIAVVLLQQGKGADMGASFGAGGSQTVFGAAGSAGPLAKVTAVLAIIFFAMSLGLAVYAKKQSTHGIIPVVTEAPKATEVPVAPAASLPTTAPATDVPQAPAGK